MTRNDGAGRSAVGATWGWELCWLRGIGAAEVAGFGLPRSGQDDHTKARLIGDGQGDIIDAGVRPLLDRRDRVFLQHLATSPGFKLPDGFRNGPVTTGLVDELALLRQSGKLYPTIRALPSPSGAVCTTLAMKAFWFIV